MNKTATSAALLAKSNLFHAYSQWWSTRVQYSYSSTTRVPIFEYSYSYLYSKVRVLGTRLKNSPSTRVYFDWTNLMCCCAFMIVVRWRKYSAKAKKHFCDQIVTNNHWSVYFVSQLNVESACVVRSDTQTNIECAVCIKD